MSHERTIVGALRPLPPLRLDARRIGTAGRAFVFRSRCGLRLSRVRIGRSRVWTFRAVPALRSRCRTYCAGIGVILPLSVFLAQIVARCSLAGGIRLIVGDQGTWTVVLTHPRAIRSRSMALAYWRANSRESRACAAKQRPSLKRRTSHPQPPSRNSACTDRSPLLMAQSCWAEESGRGVRIAEFVGTTATSSPGT